MINLPYIYKLLPVPVYIQLDDTWGDLLQQYQMMLYESIGYYGNAIKELEDLGGGFAHSSLDSFTVVFLTRVYFRWYNVSLESLPTNKPLNFP